MLVQVLDSMYELNPLLKEDATYLDSNEAKNERIKTLLLLL